MVTTASSAAPGTALVGGHERVGQGVEKGLDRDALVARDLAQGVEEFEVGLAHGVATFFLSPASSTWCRAHGAVLGGTVTATIRARRGRGLRSPLEDGARPLHLVVGEAPPAAGQLVAFEDESLGVGRGEPARHPTLTLAAGHGPDRHLLADGPVEMARRPQRALHPGARHLEGVALARERVVGVEHRRHGPGGRGDGLEIDSPATVHDDPDRVPASQLDVHELEAQGGDGGREQVRELVVHLIVHLLSAPPATGGPDRPVWPAR